MAAAVFVLVVPFDPAGGPLPDGAAVSAPPTPTATPTAPAPDATATPDATAAADSGGGLAGSGGTPLNAGAWRARWDAATSGGPVLRGPFDLYLDGRTLTWVREECSASDTAGRFFVRYYPAAADDLEGGDPYNAAGFGFADDGVYHEDMCMMRIEAPAYGLDRIVVGQYDEDGTIWAAGFPLDAGGWLARWDAVTSGEPRLYGPFGVYLGGRTLTLAREECSASDTAGRFFVRYYPAADGDLEGEQPYNTVGFAFADGGLHHEGRCMTEIEAPAYGLDRIVAGQYDEDGTIWAAGFPLEAGGWLARWDAATAGEPAADAAFGLYLDGRTLTWAREECTASDTAGRFFLRYYPAADGRPRRRAAVQHRRLRFRRRRPASRGAVHDCGRASLVPPRPRRHRPVRRRRHPLGSGASRPGRRDARDAVAALARASGSRRPDPAGAWGTARGCGCASRGAYRRGAGAAGATTARTSA